MDKDLKKGIDVMINDLLSIHHNITAHNIAFNHSMNDSMTQKQSVITITIISNTEFEEEYATFAEAKSMALKKGCLSRNDYLRFAGQILFNYIKGQKKLRGPIWIENQPEFISWDDFLGIKPIVNKAPDISEEENQKRKMEIFNIVPQNKKTQSDFLPYQEAKALVQKLGIKSQPDFYRRRKAGDEDLQKIPSCPHQSAAFRDEWISWYDFLGKPAEGKGINLHKNAQKKSKKTVRKPPFVEKEVPENVETESKQKEIPAGKKTVRINARTVILVDANKDPEEAKREYLNKHDI